MTSSRIILAFGLAGCAADIETLTISGRAGETVRLSVPGLDSDRAYGYRWELIDQPAESETISPTGSFPYADLNPDVRGFYLIDRWADNGFSEDLTHHIVVEAEGTPPRAEIRGVTDVLLGTPVLLDGTSSSSSEHRALTFRWREASRPPGSTSLPSDLDSSMITMTPDVRGNYVFELAVFDGELWAEPPASVTVQAH